jgi:hypothetical protein
MMPAQNAAKYSDEPGGNRAPGHGFTLHRVSPEVARNRHGRMSESSPLSGVRAEVKFRRHQAGNNFRARFPIKLLE